MPCGPVSGQQPISRRRLYWTLRYMFGLGDFDQRSAPVKSGYVFIRESPGMIFKHR